MSTVTCTIKSNDIEVNFSALGARYLSFTYSPAEPKPETLWTKNSLTPIYFETKQQYDKLELNFSFKSQNLASVSALTQKLLKCEVELTGTFLSGKSFDCILTDNKLASERY